MSSSRIYNKTKICKETDGKCPHLKLHRYMVECGKKLKQKYGWPNGIGCYYYPDQEYVEINFDCGLRGENHETII